MKPLAARSVSGFTWIAITQAPAGVDRRSFLIRSAVGGAAAVMTGCSVSATDKKCEGCRNGAAGPDRSVDAAGRSVGAGALAGPECREEGEGPGVDDRGRVLQGGPRPFELAHDWSDAHHLRFLPARHQAAGRQTGKATKLQVNLFGSLSATGKGHGTERAALAGLVGKEPATVDPKFLDGLRDKPDQVFPVKLGTSRSTSASRTSSTMPPRGTSNTRTR